jgi:hypothetical protein
MRPSRGIPLRFQAALVVLFFIAVPFVTPAQNSIPLPQLWNDAVAKLADKIAGDVSPRNPLSLEAKNLSGLAPSDVAIVRGALESELKKRSFHLVHGNSVAATAQSETRLQFTVSEAADGYVLVAEIQSGSEPEGAPQVVIVFAPKPAPDVNAQSNGSLSLERRLIWQQPGKFLDFTLLSGSAAADATMLAVLEPERVAYYRFQDGNWKLIQAIPIKPSARPPRDLRGLFESDGKQVFVVSYATCSGEVAQPETMKCFTTGVQHDGPPELDTQIGVPGIGEAALLGSVCGARSAALASGTGDWTQTDTLQGYESTAGQFRVSGAPLETAGPVTSLVPGSASGSARVIVYNLKTQNYEAYIVTATCGN